MSHDVYQMKDASMEKMPFKLLYVTRSEYDKGWHSTQHTHHFTELFYIMKGKGSFLLSDHEVPVQENDLVIINPNVEHTEKSNHADSLEYIAIGIEGLAFSLPKEQQSQLGLFTYQGEREEIVFYLNQLLEEMQHTQNGYEVTCQNIIEILIIKLRRAKQVTVEKTKPRQINRAVAFAKYFINQNYQSDITLDTLADAAHINKYYLAHRFKKDLQISPMEYLNQVRIKEAKRLLKTTNYRIADIAEFLSFSSQSFFTQSFKRETNYTPSNYRKNAKRDYSTPVGTRNSN